MNVQKTVRAGRWLGEVRADAVKLRRACKAAMRAAVKTPAQEWLCDNAYLFERAAKDVCTQIRALPPLPKGTKTPTALEAVCDAACDGVPVWTTDTLLQFFADKGLTEAETQALPAMLQRVILRACADGVSDAQRIGKAVRKLRMLPDVDFEKLCGAISPVERILRQDPVHAYAEMEASSREMYRTLLLCAAARKRTDADAYASAVLERAQSGKTPRARHVGAYILPPFPVKRGALFLVLEVLLPLLLCTAIGFWLHRAWAAITLFLPMWAVTAGFCMRLSLHGVRSVRMPRMEMDTVPKERQTLLTVSTLLPPAAKAPLLESHLEQLYLSNGQAYIKVCLLADLRQSGTPEKPEDGSDIAAAARVIAGLNERNGGGFVLAIRPRVYAPTEGCFSGWERKRGAITQLVREIMGKPGGFAHLSGDTDGLSDTRYLFLLDADTLLPMDAAAQLVSVAAHPLQQAVVDPKRRIVTAGYGVLAPRVCTAASGGTRFQRILRADRGLSAYDNVIGERYQDLFGEGVFAGKGLVDVRAFYETLDEALPQGRVLSHDILEGGYLRCGFVSDVQVTDEFPKNQRVFLDRLDRWLRGDWQNLRFLFGRNPLSALSRWKLFDNLRRSLTSVAALGVLLACAFLPGEIVPWLCGVCILSVAGDSLFASIRALLFRGPSAVSRLFYSGEVPDALGHFLRALAQIMMLPSAALCSASAIVKALWRSFVSHKRLLDWTTFAQSADATDRRTWTDCLWVGAVFSVLFVSPHALLKLAALLFLLDVPFSLFGGTAHSGPAKPLSFAQREQLTSYAAAMWQYFAENCDFRNNYLPPDNVQETPVYRVAQRTSPTNIGLALLCALTARDFGFLGSEQLAAFLSRAFDSIEQLPTYHGNLLNWYDTRTLQPLEPQYVSTVDCGNFLCCLKTLQQGIREYCPQEPALRDIDARIQRMLDGADLSVLYNPRRKLFYIGVDPLTDKPSDAYYDLLMSEARMTGYYAVARRTVPKKHWTALARVMGKAGRYTGPLSWTGTTFEYFMPYLFLPAPEGTLGYEALKFCAWCQKRAARSDRPFGASESGFYCFDRDFNYQYKAHGVQTLGLRRGLDKETVVAPYASFLMMQLEPHAAMRNLRRLAQMQMTGRWGFYEAVDFTPSHTGGKPYAIVRSYMAHHVGMSLLSVANVLHDGSLRRRFLRDSEMRRAQSLLQEGIPADAYIYKRRTTAPAPTVRERVEQQKREITDASPLCPNARAWTNGELSLCAADVGASACIYRGAQLFCRSADLLRRPSGPVVVLQEKNGSMPFAPMADYGSDVRFRCTFTGSDVRYAASRDDVQLRVQMRIHPTLSVLQITVSVRTRRGVEGSVLLYAEPSLTPQREAAAHPAFAKLFLEDAWDEQNRAVLFRRRERDGGQGVCMAAGFLQDTVFTCTRSKSSALRSGYGIASLLRGGVQFENEVGNGDGCIGVQIPIRLSARGSAEHTFLIAVASTRREALDKLLQIRKNGLRKGAGALFSDGKMEAVLTEKLLPGAVFGHRDAKSARRLSQNPFPPQRLWQFGLSGERPVVFKEVGSAEDAASAAPYIRAVYRLCRAGFPCALALGYSEGGAYDSPVLHALRRVIRAECGENGAEEIVPVDLHGFSQEDRDFLRAISVFELPAAAGETPSGRFRTLHDTQPAEQSEKLYRFTDTGIVMPKDQKKPYLPWSLVLCNDSFGTMVSDKSLGFTWAVNAHENQITPWYNDTSSDNRGELLILCMDGQYYDLLRGATADFTPQCAIWQGKAAGVRFRVEVTVPEKGSCKRCRVELTSGAAQEVRLFYYLEPMLGGENAFVHVERQGDGLLLSSPAAAVHGFAYLCVQGGADVTESDRASFWFDDAKNAHAGVAAVVGKTVRLVPDETAAVSFALSFAAKEKAALLLPELPKREPEFSDYLHVHSADPQFDRMVNTWLPWQARKCRFEGRTGFYQCGGAWGFRDQLQDASAFLLTDPNMARTHLLRCAAVQFTEGDVLHWWHRLPPQDGGLRGVRTRYRDDRLWLPWLAAEYVRATGDRSVLDVSVPYLAGEPLTDKETERYFAPEQSDIREPLQAHCVRAVDSVLQTGAHGLALIGGGDWNDGFNRVGIGGKGESVWLTLFLCIVLDRFAPFCDDRTAERYREKREQLLRAVGDAWDGDHYLRAYLDDGTPLGKTEPNAECRIDSVAQSFAAFAGLPAQRVRTALRTAAEKLVDREKGIVKLLDPPFTGSGRQVGYITAYPPGIRENGGQYTHAAVWLCMAMLQNGMVRDGLELFRMLNPAHFCSDAARCAQYGAEPYALAGDIPAADRPIACTGWTLYTGSAAWMYRAAVEEILGIQLKNGTLQIKPKIDPKMLPISLEMQVKQTKIHVRIDSVDGKELCEYGKIIKAIPIDGGVHTVIMR